jgi:3-hydroxybutyryl-CoA dehydrogenase
MLGINMCNMPSISQIGIVGSGIMGSGIGQVLLQHGYEVTIRDIEEERLEEAHERIESGNYGLRRAVEGGYLTEEQKHDALDNLTLTLDLKETVTDADAVIEAVPEDLSLKASVFRDLDELTDNVPLYSNTSGFPIEAIGNAVEDRSRVAGLHFFSPAQVMDLVEIVRTPEVDEGIIDTAEQLTEDIDKKSIVIEDAPKEYGFVANRIYFQGLVREAERVVEEGIATEEQVDTALTKGFNLPVGPFSMAGIGNEWD